MSKFSGPEATTAAVPSTATAGTSSSGTSGRGPAAAATGGGSSSTGSNKGTSKAESVYAGGIFSRLEAQFRAEQAARALTLQGTQTRCVHILLILNCMVDPVFP